jgi:hypothetical protein
MAAQPDLWGDLEVAPIRTPVAILKEQAAVLGQKTRNVVEARVETSLTYNSHFVHSFSLVVPALDNYEYQLFKVQHAIDLYPVETPNQSLNNEPRVYGLAPNKAIFLRDQEALRELACSSDELICIYRATLSRFGKVILGAETRSG